MDREVSFNNSVAFTMRLVHKKFLWGATGRVAEDFSEITPVDATYRSDIFNRNSILKILFHIIDRFFYIIITHAPTGDQRC